MATLKKTGKPQAEAFNGGPMAGYVIHAVHAFKMRIIIWRPSLKLEIW